MKVLRLDNSNARSNSNSLTVDELLKRAAAALRKASPEVKAQARLSMANY